MSEEEMFEQLYDLIDDRKSLMGSDEETNFIYKKDIQAIKQIMNGYKEYSLELSGYRQAILDDKEMLGLKDENKELKKQLEEKKMLIKQCDLSISKVMDCYCERTDCSGRIKDSKQYDSLVQKVETQQQEFIKYLEDKIYSIEPKGTGINYNCEYDSEEDYVMAMQEQSRLNTLKEILQKYKEIIGCKDENNL